MLAEEYILLDSLLFKLVTTPEKETALLAIPETCANKILHYHSSLFAGHQCMIKMYLTIGDKFFIPHLIHYLCSYIKGCHTWQQSRSNKPPTRQLQTRINLNYGPLSRLSLDLNIGPRLYKGHKFILCIIDGVTNYLITALIHHCRSEEGGDDLIENVISKYCVPNYIIMDQDSTFMSLLMSYLFKKLDIKIKTVTLYNHQSLQTEHGIKSLSIILTKHLTDLGQMWPKYLPFATLPYNTCNSPNLANCSPYELVFSRKPKLLLDLETNPDIKVSRTFKDYYTLLNKRLEHLHKLLQDFKSKRMAMINKVWNFFQYSIGDLVYIISLFTSQLWTSSRKVGYKICRPFGSVPNYRPT